MQVESSPVAKFKITGVEGLDTIAVLLEDHAPGQGSITIRCADQIWSGGWRAMGADQTTGQFVSSAGADYLIGAMCPGLQQIQHSQAALIITAKRCIIDRRRNRNGSEWELGELSKADARELWTSVTRQLHNSSGMSLSVHSGLLTALFGDEWWFKTDEATEPNPRWIYLERVIEAVRQALKTPAAGGLRVAQEVS